MNSPTQSKRSISMLVQEERERENARRDAIRNAIASSTPPLSNELVDKIVSLFITDVHLVMQSHEGFLLAERRRTYRAALSTLELSIGDLLAAIDDFSVRALETNSSIFDRREQNTLTAIRNRIQKELFAAAGAAASLVDHSRRIQTRLELSDFDEQRQRHFGDDGLHEFVIALRKLLHHLNIVEAGYNLQADEYGRYATFMIPKATLRRVIAQEEISGRANVMRFVDAHQDNVDLRSLFVAYLERIKTFHAWLSSKLESDDLVALRDYRRILREKKKRDLRMGWKALLANWLRNWKIPPDPHKHLPRYLTAEQLAAVYALPRNSRAQVDLAIRFVDEHNAIDDELRALAYELFERSSPVDAADTASPAA